LLDTDSIKLGHQLAVDALLREIAADVQNA
jgi:hypothetical protein